MNRTIYRFVPS